MKVASWNQRRYSSADGSPLKPPISGPLKGNPDSPRLSTVAMVCFRPCQVLSELPVQFQA